MPLGPFSVCLFLRARTDYFSNLACDWLRIVRARDKKRVLISIMPWHPFLIPLIENLFSYAVMAQLKAQHIPYFAAHFIDRKLDISQSFHYVLIHNHLFSLFSVLKYSSNWSEHCVLWTCRAWRSSLIWYFRLLKIHQCISVAPGKTVLYMLSAF